MPTSNSSMIVTFADETAILFTAYKPQSAQSKLLNSLQTKIETLGLKPKCFPHYTTNQYCH